MTKLFLLSILFDKFYLNGILLNEALKVTEYVSLGFACRKAYPQSPAIMQVFTSIIITVRCHLFQ